MSTWIAHFRIAEMVLKELPGLDETAFILGNVAPDSGRPNHDWTVFDPPKSVTHFLRPGEDEGRIPDLEFYRGYVVPRQHTTDYSFVLGYFTHLVADNLWMHLVGEPTKRDFAEQFAADRAGTWERVKDDWYGLDHKYLRDQPGNVFARVVAGAANPPSPLDFLPDEALADRLDDLRSFYAAPEGFILDRAYPYLSEARMTRTVEESARIILGLMSRLQAGEVSPEARVSLPLLNLPDADALP